MGEKFVLNRIDSGSSPRPPLHYWAIRVTKGAKVQVFEKDICGIPDIDGPALHFKCDSDGKSPLAGSTFVVKKELTKCRGTLYVCKTGCAPRVPQTLIKEPWECRTPSSEPYIEPCASNNTKKAGIVSTNGVNLREQPEITAQVLASLSKETKVKILERRESCVSIDHEAGQWVKVEVSDGKSANVGWVFDAYIEY